ncbi:MAG TPA: YdeI/OmpD-associated family protein [Pseudonocardiaceae bacterium]
MRRGPGTASGDGGSAVACFGTARQWRAWLERHHDTATEQWVVIRRTGTSPAAGGTADGTADAGPDGTADGGGVTYEEAVEQALCFGWIDGLHRRRDETSTVLRFTPRAARSTWSALNRERAARMIARGLMTPAGQAAIDAAHATGRWELRMPDDLRAALDANPAARRHYDAFPPSSRHLILQWILDARRPATRERRITETVALAARNVRANQPGPTSRR